jgi:uncharacterized membrane protein YkvA (DUF1232 family)
MGNSNGNQTKVLHKLKEEARRLKRNVYVIYLAYKDPRVPWLVKAFVICVVAYAFSPIDLIPDFIPVLGYLDDLIIVPLGVALALRMIPDPVLDDCRLKAEEMRNNGKPANWFTGVLIIIIWVACGIWLGNVIYRAILH